MKRDFSQPFVASDDQIITLVIRDNKTKKFLLLENQAKNAPVTYELPTATLRSGKSFARQLTHFLFANRIVSIAFTQLAAEKHISFDFVDDAPATEFIEGCYYITADITNVEKLAYDFEGASLVSFDTLIEKLQGSELGEVSKIGLSILEGRQRLFQK